MQGTDAAHTRARDGSIPSTATMRSLLIRNASGRGELSRREGSVRIRSIAANRCRLTAGPRLAWQRAFASAFLARCSRAEDRGLSGAADAGATPAFCSLHVDRASSSRVLAADRASRVLVSYSRAARAASPSSAARAYARHLHRACWCTASTPNRERQGSTPWRCASPVSLSSEAGRRVAIEPLGGAQP